MLKKVIKIIAKIIVFALMFIVLSYLLIRIPKVQSFLASRAAYILSKKINTEVRVGGVDIEFFNKIILEDVYLEDQHRDTIVCAGSIKLFIADYSLDKGFFRISKTELKDAVIKVAKYPKEKGLNFQFIIDAFKSNKKRTDTTASTPVKLYCNNFDLINCQFSYSDFRKKHGEKNFVDWDYLQFNKINGNLSNMDVFEDSAFFNLNNISFVEKSGFTVNKFSSKSVFASDRLLFMTMKIVTPNSYINGSLGFFVNTYDDFDDFFEKVTIRSHLINTDLNMCDLIPFARELKGINKPLRIVNAELKGTVNNFTGKNIDISFGEITHLKGKIHMTGLPDINNTLIDFRIKQLVTNKKDMEGIPLPPFEKRRYIELPEEINRLGVITYTGDYTGFYNDFVTYGRFSTALGDANTDIKINYNLNTEITSYSGKLKTSNFNIGKLIGNTTQFGEVTMNASINGSEFDLAHIKAEMEGEINSIDLMGYNYKNIHVDGGFNKKIFKGDLTVDDPNMQFVFKGSVDYSKKFTRLDFYSKVANANLSATGLVNAKNTISFSGIFNIDFTGNSVDDVLGTLNINNLNIHFDEKDHDFGDIKLYSDKIGDSKQIILRSNFADINMDGYFSLSTLPTSIQNFINYYVTTVFNTTATKNIKTNDDFTFNIHLKKSDYLTDLVAPNLKIAPNTIIAGTYNFNKHLEDFQITSPHIIYNNIRFNKVNVLSKASNENAISIDTKIQRINFSDSVYIANVAINTNTSNNLIDYKIMWDNQEKVINRGNLKGSVSFKNPYLTSLTIAQSSVVLHDTLWTITENNEVLFDSSGVFFKDVKILHEQQSLTVNGKLSQAKQDKLLISVNHLNMSQFNVLLRDADVELQGVTDGTFSIGDIYNNPIFTAHLKLNNLTVNKELIGSGNVLSNWDASLAAVNMTGDIFRDNVPSINFSGNYFPYRKKDNLDYTFRLKDTPLQIISMFTTDILSEIKGNLNGNLFLKGTFKNPELTGILNASKAKFKVDYLNTTYSFNHEIIIKSNVIEVNNALLFDESNNRATTNFKLHHTSFSKFKFDISIESDKLHCLNTGAAQNELFYGQAYASGLIKIYGPTNKIVIDANVKTEKGTRIFIPLENPEEISENDFVHFISRDTLKNKKIGRRNFSGVQMNLDLEVTPDAETQLIFDQKVGDVIKGNGNGNIRMEINTMGQFNMFGGFSIVEGDYLFTLKNVINKHFKIEEGGTIKWSGDPYNADINITANYSLKTSLAPVLLPDSTNSAKRRSVPVSCKLKLTDKLFTPNVNFAIDLTSNRIDQSLKDEFYTQVRPDDIQETNRQMFALLILGSFITPAGRANTTTAGTSYSSSAANNSLELLSNQLNNWLSGISKNVDIGVKYRAGSENTSQQAELILSTQLFNNKLLVDGNFGVSNNSTKATAATTTNNNYLVGDVKLEYKLTDDGKLRLKAYNQTNDISSLIYNHPYTQGFGIYYRQEFENLSSLFRRSKKAYDSK